MKYIDTNDKAYLLGRILGTTSEGIHNDLLEDGKREKNKSFIKVKATIDYDDYYSDDCDMGYYEAALPSISGLKSIITDELGEKALDSYRDVDITFEDASFFAVIKKLSSIKKGKQGMVVESITFPDLKSDDLKWNFLRGIFDSHTFGGSVTVNDGEIPEYSFSSISKNFVNQIKDFCNIPCRVSNTSYSRHHRTQIDWKGVNCIELLGKIYETYNYTEIAKLKAYQRLITEVKPSPYFSFNKESEDAVTPSKERISDSGYDLTLISICKGYCGGKVVLYDTGIKVSPSHGYYMDLVPRSSIIKTGYMMANGVGIIDRAYRGTIKVPLIKIDESIPDLELPCRLVQMIPRSIVHMKVKEVSDKEFDDTDRGSGGFGSSGK